VFDFTCIFFEFNEGYLTTKEYSDRVAPYVKPFMFAPPIKSKRQAVNRMVAEEELSLKGFISKYEEFEKRFLLLDEVKHEYDKIKNKIMAQTKKLNLLSDKYRRLGEIEKRIKDKKNTIEKIERKKAIPVCNGQNIKQFTSEKIAEGSFNRKIFEAFVIELTKETDNQANTKDASELWVNVYISRIYKIQFEVALIFFSPGTLKVFSGLKYLNFSVISDKMDAKLGTSLGYIVLLLNSLSKYNNFSFKYPMNFYGSRSLIFRNKIEVYPLFGSKTDKNRLDQGLQFLEKNLKQIAAYLNREKYGEFMSLQQTSVFNPAIITKILQFLNDHLTTSNFEI